MKRDDQLEKLIVQNGIEDLLARFDDAVIRYDREAFRSLWTGDAEWEIGAPVPMKAEGVDKIVETLGTFHAVNWMFFRITNRPVIHVEGDTATFRAPTVELAARKGGMGYRNVAIYYDSAIFDGERWRFTSRYYQYLWVDLSTKLDGEIVPLSVRERGGTAV